MAKLWIAPREVKNYIKSEYWSNPNYDRIMLPAYSEENLIIYTRIYKTDIKAIILETKNIKLIS